MKKIIPELLAPAGDWLSLRAAVSNGADAVYFGSGAFNARRRAENFSEKDLSEVIAFCHQNGVRAYLAANILVKNHELPDYFKLIAAAYSAGIDAVIIQHLSFVSILKQNFPGLEVHLSTQAAVYNSRYAKLIKGADRVILPREFSLNQARELHEKTNIPIESFVQGALCFSMSGECLMSSFLGGRSGNRGLCAQPCRKKYNKKFLLSTKDLCLVEKLPQLIDAGIASFKIEGRLRSPEYVGASTSLYRRALDSIESGKFTVDKDALQDLEIAFSRGYTSGMMFKENDVVAPEAGGKRGISLGVLGRGGAIKIAAPIKLGDGVGIFSGNKSHGDIIRRIESNGKKITSAKAGQTIRLFINAKACDEIVLSSGKESRAPYRFEKKKPLILRREKPVEVSFGESIEENAHTEDLLLVKVYNLKDADEAFSAGADAVFYNILSKDYPKNDEKISPYIPRCMFDWSVEKALGLIDGMKSSAVLSGDLGAAAALSLKEKKVFLDLSGNVFNDLDVSYWNKLGTTPMVSPELSLKELGEFKDKRFIVYAHGRLPLMSTKYALREDKLTDELGYTFPVRTESDYRQVLNSVTLALFDKVNELKKEGIRQFFLDLDTGAGQLTNYYKKTLSGEKVTKPKGEYTIGNYRRGVL